MDRINKLPNKYFSHQDIFFGEESRIIHCNSEIIMWNIKCALWPHIQRPHFPSTCKSSYFWTFEGSMPCRFSFQTTCTTFHSILSNIRWDAAYLLKLAKWTKFMKFTWTPLVLHLAVNTKLKEFINFGWRPDWPVRIFNIYVQLIVWSYWSRILKINFT